MINFGRTNNLAGWLVFAVALTVYALTLEPSVSFWDCGEFIAASYKLQIVHPPGAPLYQMLGRLFSLVADTPDKIAFWVNMLSAVASAFAVLFTYFITTRLAVKIINPGGLPLSSAQVVGIIGAGIIAALSLTFTDTFWFSATEAEVYALSSFFTMLVYWAALRWTDNFNPRWLLFIAFATGLSVGVHLLNLLVLPGVVFVCVLGYYGVRPKTFWAATGLALLLLAVVHYFIIPGIPALAARTDRWLVNGAGFGIGKGALLFIVVLALAMAGAIRAALFFRLHKIALAVVCFCFLLVGFSSYILVPIRAAAEPPLNVGNPADPVSFVSYLNRDQYGSRSLFYGPYYNAPITNTSIGKDLWFPENGRYIVADNASEYTYDSTYMTLFPRMGDVGSSSSKTGYVGWTFTDPTRPPSFMENLEYYFKYQFLHMYVRYHLWNFAGRQNDRQGHGNAMDGNGVTGIGFIDHAVAAPEKGLPNELARNKGRNFYYLLPLILGLIGLFYHARRPAAGFYPLLVLFLFTGVVLSVYLNAPPFEPRERDYVFVGSFQVFCIWIGLGALWLGVKLQRYITKGIWLGIIVSVIISPFILAAQNWDDHDRSGRTFALDFARNTLNSLAPNAILFVYGDNATYPLWYLQNVEGVRTDVRVVNAHLLNTNWAAYEMAQQQYQSGPFTMTVSPPKYRDGIRTYVRTGTNGSTMSLKEALEFINNDSNTTTFASGRKRCYIPASLLTMELDERRLVDSFIFSPGEIPFLSTSIQIPVGKSFLYRAECIMLDIISNNFYNRPVYFSSQSEADNLPQLNQYLKLEGLAYRLTPLKYPHDTTAGHFNRMNSGQMARALQKMEFRGYNNPKLYINPEAITIARHYRVLFSVTVEKMLAEGKTSRAAELAKLCNEKIPGETVDYKYPHNGVIFLKALYAGQLTAEAEKLYKSLVGNLAGKTTYYNSLLTTIADFEARSELQKLEKTLLEIESLVKEYNQPEKIKELETLLALFPQKTTEK